MSWFSKLIGTDKVVDTLGDVAKEWIETDMESAEAKAVMVKALDPNGRMRKQISEDVTQMYKIYIYVTAFLVLFQASGVGADSQVKLAVENLTSLFLPITGMFSSIVLASFGVNATNSIKGK